MKENFGNPAGADAGGKRHRASGRKARLEHSGVDSAMPQPLPDFDRT